MCRPQPLAGEADAHHGVAEGDEGEVVVREEPGYAGGEDQHAGDLHEDSEPVGDVVGVVGGREPREVHPRPPDGEEHQRV